MGKSQFEITPHIAGVGMTIFSSGDERSLIELLVTAAERALLDAGLEPRSVDSLHVGNMAAEVFNGCSGLGNALAGTLGTTNAAPRRIENTSASGASAFRDAVDAIRAGSAEVALVVGGERMSAVDAATATEIISRIVHQQEYQQGVTLPAFGGLVTDRYLHEYEGTRRDLARVAVKNHANAASNPYAQFNKRIDIEDVLDSPKIASPLRLYDCCPRSDGAAAIVLTADNETKTVENRTGRPSIQVAACENTVDTHAVGDRPNPLVIKSVATAGERAYTAADIGPKEIDVACVHDAFSILEWLIMEELGLAARGNAWHHTRNGDTAIDGEIPINPGGGLKARGHPLGATGISQIVELVWQFRGDVSPKRVVGDVSCGLAVSLAGFGNSAVCTILKDGNERHA